jgi:UDP-3-O-[3-hydroxymyristoyl] N-acetylglucosamine deacetylase
MLQPAIVASRLDGGAFPQLVRPLIDRSAQQQDHTLAFDGLVPGMTGQKTLRTSVTVAGIGLHSGLPVRMTVSPADGHTGIVFVRTDIAAGSGSDQRVVHARWDSVSDTRLCTVVSNAHGVSVATIEHLMAALRGCGIDNALIEINGPEVPVVDGSAAPFVKLFTQAGIKTQTASRNVVRVLKPVTVVDGDRSVSLRPASRCRFSMEIEFKAAAIGRQHGGIDLAPGIFGDVIAPARTFGFLRDVAALQASGLAKGGSLDNAVVVDDDDAILNPGGLRFADEFVRHKILDSIGDLYLAGAPIVGHFHGVRSGHALNNRLLRTMFADDSSWCFDTIDPSSVPVAPLETRELAAIA